MELKEHQTKELIGAWKYQYGDAITSKMIQYIKGQNVKTQKQKIYKRNKIVEKYLEENGIGTWNKRHYRLRYHLYNIYKLFDKYYFKTNGNAFDYNNFISDLTEIKKSLFYVLKDIKKDYCENPRKYNMNDWTHNEIECELAYINSKWRCQHRIEFLLALINYERNKNEK